MAPLEAASGEGGGTAVDSSGGPVTIHLTKLQEAIGAARAAGKTPLIADTSEAHAVDTFFGYSAVMVDAKQCSLNVAIKRPRKSKAWKRLERASLLQ